MLGNVLSSSRLTHLSQFCSGSFLIFQFFCLKDSISAQPLRLDCPTFTVASFLMVSWHCKSYTVYGYFHVLYKEEQCHHSLHLLPGYQGDISSSHWEPVPPWISHGSGMKKNLLKARCLFCSFCFLFTLRATVLSFVTWDKPGLIETDKVTTQVEGSYYYKLLIQGFKQDELYMVTERFKSRNRQLKHIGLHRLL